jgi:hypothetical protein
LAAIVAAAVASAPITAIAIAVDRPPVTGVSTIPAISVAIPTTTWMPTVAQLTAAFSVARLPSTPILTPSVLTAIRSRNGASLSYHS